MLPVPTQIATFTSASSKGVVNVELGFKPDFVILISNFGGTNPDCILWVNNATVPGWTAALSILITGSTGVFTRDTTGITVYAGGDTIASDEAATTDGKHVTLDGTVASAGHITSAGITIPADHQTNSGTNAVIAFRINR